MTNLSDLIERVEAAEEGSRALDGAIAAALGLYPYWAPKHHERQPELFSDGGPGLRARTWLAPKFTSSLDAAMTLVPEGSLDHAEIYSPDHQTLGWTFHLISNANFQRPTITGFAATLPLALVAASLRALQEKDIEHG